MTSNINSVPTFSDELTQMLATHMQGIVTKPTDDPSSLINPALVHLVNTDATTHMKNYATTMLGASEANKPSDWMNYASSIYSVKNQTQDMLAKLKGASIDGSYSSLDKYSLSNLKEYMSNISNSIGAIRKEMYHLESPQAKNNIETLNKDLDECMKILSSDGLGQSMVGKNQILNLKDAVNKVGKDTLIHNLTMINNMAKKLDVSDSVNVMNSSDGEFNFASEIYSVFHKGEVQAESKIKESGIALAGGGNIQNSANALLQTLSVLGKKTFIDPNKPSTTTTTTTTATTPPVLKEKYIVLNNVDVQGIKVNIGRLNNIMASEGGPEWDKVGQNPELQNAIKQCNTVLENAKSRGTSIGKPGSYVLYLSDLKTMENNAQSVTTTTSTILHSISLSMNEQLTNATSENSEFATLMDKFFSLIRGLSQTTGAGI